MTSFEPSSRVSDVLRDPLQSEHEVAASPDALLKQAPSRAVGETDSRVLPDCRADRIDRSLRPPPPAVCIALNGDPVPPGRKDGCLCTKGDAERAADECPVRVSDCVNDRSRAMPGIEVEANAFGSEVPGGEAHDVYDGNGPGLSGRNDEVVATRGVGRVRSGRIV